MLFYCDEGEQYKPSILEMILFLAVLILPILLIFYTSEKLISLFLLFLVIWMFMRSSRKDMKAAGALFGSIITGAIFYIISNFDKIRNIFIRN